MKNYFLFFCLLFCAGKAFSQAETFTGFSIFGKDDRQYINNSDGSYPWSAIGKATIQKKEASKFAGCTVTKISSKLALTAAHCFLDYLQDLNKFNLNNALLNSQLIFGFYKQLTLEQKTDRLLNFKSIVAMPEEFKEFASVPTSQQTKEEFKRTAEFDWAILQLNEEDKNIIETIPPIPLQYSENLPNKNENVVHIGYPGDLKEFPIVDASCKIYKKTNSLLVTDCDAFKGQSGGPLFEAKNFYKDKNGKFQFKGMPIILGILSGGKDGKNLTVSISEPEAGQYFVSINSILNYLKKLNPEVYELLLSVRENKTFN